MSDYLCLITLIVSSHLIFSWEKCELYSGLFLSFVEWMHILVFTATPYCVALINRSADSKIPASIWVSVFESAQMLRLPVAKACGEENFIRLCETQWELLLTFRTAKDLILHKKTWWHINATTAMVSQLV